MGFLDKIFPPPNKERFAQIVTKVLRGGGESRPIRYESQDFRLLVGGEKPFIFYLGNVYQEYLGLPRGQRKQFLANYATFTQQTGDVGLEEAKGKLLPRVRERFYHEAVRLHMLAEGKEEYPSATQLLNEHLTVEAVIDAPQLVATVAADHLKEWGISLDEALAIGRENLWELSKKGLEQATPGVWVSKAQDTHDASRMFLHDLVWQHAVKGKHVVMVPNRNVLMVGGSEDAEALAVMAQISKQVLNEPRAMTGVAFELEGTKWRQFLPPEDSPLRATFIDLALGSLARDYSEQKELLEKIHQRRGEDIFVAKAMFMERKRDGSIFSFAAWAEGCVSLLPKVDYLMMGGRVNGEIEHLGYVRWDRFEQVAGDMMQATKHHPPRFLVTSFPSREQLAAMDLTPDTP